MIRSSTALPIPAGLIVLVSLPSCGSSSPELPVEPPLPTCVARPLPFASFTDADNTGTGRDLVARLGPAPASDCTDAFRVFVSRDGDQVTDPSAAVAIPVSRTVRLPADYGGGVLDFATPGVDANGDPIAEGVAYRLQVLALGNSDPGLVTSLSPVELANVATVRTISPEIQAGSGGLETDDEGNIYTADFGATLSGPPGNQIHRVTPTGDVSVFATGFSGASGNDRAENGDLFQSSIQGGSIQRVTPAGEVSTFATGLSGPVGIEALPGDTLIVAGCGDNTIRRVEPDGEVSTLSNSSLFNCPNGIARASDGNYYVANFGHGWVHRVTPSGEVTSLVQMPSGNAGHILWGLDALWVVDRGGHRLWRVTLNGDMTPVAGSGTRGRGDGGALDATLSLTNDIAFSPDSTRLYFNDVARTSGPPSTISPVIVRALIFARPEG